MSAVLDTSAESDRTQFLGGSDAAAVLGVSPWATPVELWLDKTGRAQKAAPDAARERIFRRGKKLEPFVLEMVIDKLREQGHTVELLARNQRYADREHSFLSCEIDFELLLDGEHINGDCKTVIGFARKKWGEEETEDVPIEYAAQFMHGMMCTGRKRCLVAALIGLDDVAIYWVVRDEETIAAMREKEVRFWVDHVLGGTPPDAFTFSDIKALFPLDNGLAIKATQEIAEKVGELAGVKARISTLEKQEVELTFAIGEYISPHALLTFNGRQVASWKAQNDTRLDQKAFREAEPETFAKFTRTKAIRVLRLNSKGI